MSYNTNLENQKNKNSGWLFAIYTIITMCIYILPAAKLIIPYLIAGSIMLISMIAFMLQDDEMLKYSLALILVSFCFLIIELIHNASLSNAVNEMIRNIRFFIPVMWGVYALRTFDKKQNTTIIVFCLILFVYLLINTLIALVGDPMIARILAQGKETSDSEINTYRLSNICGFEFSYMMGIIDLCALWVFFNKKEKFIKIFSMCIYLLIFYYIVQAQYTTLLLLTFVGSVVLAFVSIKNTITRVILTILSILLIYFIIDIFYYLSNLFSDVLLGAKFRQLADSINGGGTEELGKRPELIRNAFITWLNNPILGADASKLNAHSMIMSTLAGSGLVGLLLLIYIFYISIKLIYARIKEYKNGKSIFICSNIFLIALAFFNPIGYVFEMTIATYFIVPIFIKQFCEKED